MKHLLRIDASARQQDSVSKELGDEFERLWQLHSQGSVDVRDLSQHPVEQIQQITIAGFYTPPDHMTAELQGATSLSDGLIEELQQADTLLITLPLYNFGIPASLKAWVDQIVRINRTFSYENGQFGGLVNCPRALVLLAYGAEGYGEGGPLAAFDFAKPYLEHLLKFIGIERVTTVTVEGTTGDETLTAQRLKEAKEELATLAKEWHS